MFIFRSYDRWTRKATQSPQRRRKSARRRITGNFFLGFLIYTLSCFRLWKKNLQQRSLLLNQCLLVITRSTFMKVATKVASKFIYCCLFVLSFCLCCYKKYFSFHFTFLFVYCFWQFHSLPYRHQVAIILILLYI